MSLYGDRRVAGFAESNMARYMTRLEAERGYAFGGDYHALWRWPPARRSSTARPRGERR
jgi:hypothetical protein